MEKSVVSRAKHNLEKFLESLEDIKDEEEDGRAPILVYLGFPAPKHNHYYVYAGNGDKVKRTFGELREQGKVDMFGFIPYIVMRQYFDGQKDVPYGKLKVMKSKKLRSFIKFLKIGQGIHREYVKWNI